MKTRFLAAAIIAAMPVVLHAPSHAQAQKPDAPPASFTVISPVFGQLVSFSIPSNFAAGFENTNGGFYTREAVPKGETVEKWTEMITVTGAKGLANSPNASAEHLARWIAGEFQQACPDSFDARGSAAKIGGYDAFVGVAGCGKVGRGAHVGSEAALIVVIKGSADIYTLQWAERGAASGKPDVEHARWQDRLKQLAPIKLCPIVPGERAPYPSCVGKP